jgi:hypothetical protein
LSNSVFILLNLICEGIFTRGQRSIHPAHLELHSFRINLHDSHICDLIILKNGCLVLVPGSRYKKMNCDPQTYFTGMISITTVRL